MIDLTTKAEQVLHKNWKQGFTIPSEKLYPFQWNWDSGFVSLGLSHFSIDMALKEITSLFSGQWENGMIPHIIFHSEKEETYFPNFDFWNSNCNPGAPKTPKSSGITQPAVHGFVLEHLLNKHPTNNDIVNFAKDIFHKVVDYHRFLYTYRDPDREGLMFIYHPWESGRDNSPIWDESLDRIKIVPGELPAYNRRDTSIANSEERPTSYQYDRYVSLLELGKKHQYDGKRIWHESPFIVQDNMMNAILIKSNKSLIEIGDRFGLDTGELREWQQQSLKAFNAKLWSSELETYVSYDVRGDNQMKHKEIGGLTALFAGIPSRDQAAKLNNYIVSLHERGYYVCPSFDVDSPLFDSKRYWRGPIWPQMNWMIHHGLKNYGFEQTADIVKSDILELVRQQGFYEYFESQKDIAKSLKKGYGGGQFSWTAACVLDLINSTNL